MFRVIDANLNRICEGLRVIEEYLRFSINEKQISGQLKNMRHVLRERISAKVEDELFTGRDAQGDPGKQYSKIESNRTSIHDLLRANFLRIQEGLRVLEEYFKLADSYFNEEDITVIKEFRFTIYQLEKEVYFNYQNEKAVSKHDPGNS